MTFRWISLLTFIHTFANGVKWNVQMFFQTLRRWTDDEEWIGPFGSRYLKIKTCKITNLLIKLHRTIRIQKKQAFFPIIHLQNLVFPLE